MRRIASVLLLIVLILAPVALCAKSAEQDNHEEIIFLLDVSNSMNETDRARLVPDAVKQMLYSLPSNFDAGFITYGSELQTVCELGQDREQLRRAIDQVIYAGYTNAGAGLEKAVHSFSDGRETRKTVVLLSDGEITLEGEQATRESLQRYSQAAREAASQGTRIIVVSLGDRGSAPQANIYNTGDGVIKIYEAASMEQLSGVAKKIVFEDLGVRKTSVSVGEVKGGKLKVQMPTVNLTSARVLITSVARLENIAANYNAKAAEIIAGERFAAVRIDQPQLKEAEVYFDANGGEIRADLIPEMEAIVQVEVLYPGSANTSEDKVALVHLIPVRADDPSVLLFDDPYFENKGVRLTVDGTPTAAKLEAGVIRVPISAEKPRAVDITVDFSELGVNVVAPRQISVEIKEMGDHMKTILAAIGILVILGVLIWWRRTKPQIPAPPVPMPSKYEFAGKLNLYVTQAPDGSDIAPRSYNLYCMFSRDEISLGTILEKCGVAIPCEGSHRIMLSPGAAKALALTNNSDCTILKNRDLIMKRRSCLLYFEEKVTITFEDEATELILHYKNVKPGERS